MTPTARRRWPWYLLIGSLAVNMLAGGFVVAHALRPPPPSPEQAIVRFIDDVTQRLSPEDAAILRRALDDARPLFVRMHAARTDFGARLRTELIASPFDPERIRALFDSSRAADDAVRAEIESRVVETIKRLSPQGRLGLAEGHGH
ncbi:periplasmic heavy metal sensor [Azospirillum griseum]|uniref:Periplasmic heavy metal sensor n=1 Tax=Azospirillum griseum TaxID=2496639 RepID=A0A3S0RAL5_9PROT|nr:periplasmic heavy metal sensor [Azospirillum griseum]RTR22412.1 periplasmic heavy metal sensor [Azospirillum griseum]